MSSKLMIALALASIAAPALAQEGEAERRVFSGPRVEALAGYEEADEQKGLAYGVAAGIDFDLGGVVAGFEAELGDSSASFDSPVTTVDYGRDVYFGTRVGAKLGRATLLYGKAGFVHNKREVEVRSGVVGAPLRFTEGSQGVRVGGGLERAVGRRAFAKVEYRYSDYDDPQEKHQAMVGFGLRF